MQGFGDMARTRVKRRPAMQPERRHSIQSNNSELRVDESQQDESDNEEEEDMGKDKSGFKLDESNVSINEPAEAPEPPELVSEAGGGERDIGSPLPATAEAPEPQEVVSEADGGERDVGSPPPAPSESSSAEMSSFIPLTSMASQTSTECSQEAPVAPTPSTEDLQNDPIPYQDDSFVPSQVYSRRVLKILALLLITVVTISGMDRHSKGLSAAGHHHQAPRLSRACY